MEKASQAFEKAIAADPKYIPPYVSLAALEIQAEKYEAALDVTGKALDLDPTIVFANFLQAAANFKLDRLDAAEKSAEQAEKGPHQNIPQVHALLADIFVQKHDYERAATQMRTYLKEAPQGPLAAEMRRNLEQTEKTASAAGGKSSTSTAEPQTAP